MSYKIRLESEKGNSQTEKRNYEAYPENMINEIKMFIERNIISTNKNKVKICKQCLKAFIIEKALESNLDLKQINLISKKIKGPAGHGGYYLDEKRLKRISFGGDI